MFEDPNNSKRTSDKQESHTLDAAKLLEYDLKNTLSSLAHHLFGDGELIKMGIFWSL